MENLQNKKKILLICNTTFVYKKFIHSLGKSLVNNFNVSVLVGIDKDNLSIGNKKNIFFVPMPSRNIFNIFSFFKSINYFRNFFINNQYDIVITNNRDASLCSRTAIFFLKKNLN